MKSTEKQDILDKLTLLEIQKENLLQQLHQINSDINNFIFENLDEAQDTLMDMFMDKAHDACKGSYNVGDEIYTQEFIIDGHKFLGTGTFEYNCYDRQYYYVDGQEWSYELLD